MRVEAGGNGCGGCGACSACGGAAAMGSKFDAAMKAESQGGMSDIASALDGIAKQMQTLVQQLQKLIQSMSGKSSGGSSIGTDGGVRSVGTETGGLGGSQGPSERIPDPVQDVREIRLGSKTMTIGSDGSASTAEVDAAASELQRMYDVSPTFRSSVESAGSDTLTVTMGRRGDNTSWGGGSRVFLNLNNIDAGNNDRFQGIVGHEFAHAANGLPHGAALDAIEDRVRAEA